MKLMVAGGGTGGHLFPAIAVADYWTTQTPSNQKQDVFFVGTKYGLEARLVPSAGYRLYTVSQSGFKRKNGWARLVSFFQVPWSLIQALWIVYRERPDVAFGVGGYASLPGILAAFIARIPTVILEPNAAPGLANRLLAPLVDKIISPYQEVIDCFKSKKGCVLPVPVRASLLSACFKPKPWQGQGVFRILVLGGSLGARDINQILSALAVQLYALGDIDVTHQTGTQDELKIKMAYESQGILGERIHVHAFISDMAAAYAETDLVICRAGASTLAELACVKKPAILVPLPTATDNHQLKNAMAYARTGAAIVVEQKNLQKELVNRVSHFLREPEQLAHMMQCADTLQAHRSTAEFFKVCVSLVNSCTSLK